MTKKILFGLFFLFLLTSPAMATFGVTEQYIANENNTLSIHLYNESTGTDLIGADCQIRIYNISDWSLYLGPTNMVERAGANYEYIINISDVGFYRAVFNCSINDQGTAGVLDFEIKEKVLNTAFFNNIMSAIAAVLGFALFALLLGYLAVNAKNHGPIQILLFLGAVMMALVGTFMVVESAENEAVRNMAVTGMNALMWMFIVLVAYFLIYFLYKSFLHFQNKRKKTYAEI